ncbi:MAG: PglZ domain-containing protein [Methanobrevibacter sp.]|jgi:hypothetical protein|nr:PglZ domain-containing protein [Candidatus Methanoflexus mossambicus]
MNKWYQYFLNQLKYHNRVFVYDEHGLLKSMDFYKDLSRFYEINKYENEGNLHLFLDKNKDKPILVYSNEKIRLKFIEDNFDTYILDLNKIFPDLDINTLNNMNLNDLQEIYDYYDDLKSKNSFMDKINLNEILLSQKLNNNKQKIKDNKQKTENNHQELKDKLKIDIENFNNHLNSFNNSSNSDNSDSDDSNSNALDLDNVNQDNEFYIDSFDLERIDDLFVLSKSFFEIIYTIQYNKFSFNDFIDIDGVYGKLDSIFKTIVKENVFDKLIHYPHNKRPYTLNKLLDHIYYKFKEDKVALIVMDGMSYDEWFILKNYLESFKITENESFAILPTVTAYSRTSMFSGKLPKFFMDDNFNVMQNVEEKGFEEYFKNKNVDEKDILFGRIDLNNNKIIKNINSNKEEIEFEYLKGYKAIGLISNLFDDNAHTNEGFGANKSNLYNDIKNDIESSSLIHLFEKLKEFGYKIILSSDHGNLYCKGNGIKFNKNLQFDKKSKRVLIYDEEVFANKLINENGEKLIKYQSKAFPKELYFILAKYNEFFSKTDSYSITHGSYSPEEWIVPVVILE